MPMRRHLFWHAYLIPASVIVGLSIGGWYTFLTAILLFVVNPLTDPLFPNDRRNPRPDEIAGLERTRAWSWPLWFAVPTQLAIIGIGLWAIAARQDPATARKGEGYYAFLRRVLVGSLVSAWHIECDRLERRGKRPASLANRMVRYGIATVIVYAAILVAFGWPGILFFAAQSFVAIAELEMINYIEHYGLVRRQNGGATEPVAAHHAWDTDSPLTNWYLFQLGRHADHHLHAGRRYQLLESLDDSPRLPAGYSAMVVLAMIPPWWRRVMDHRVEAARERG